MSLRILREFPLLEALLQRAAAPAPEASPASGEGVLPGAPRFSTLWDSQVPPAVPGETSSPLATPHVTEAVLWGSAPQDAVPDTGDILYLGLNYPSSLREASALESAQGARVSVVQAGLSGDYVGSDDLASVEGVSAFAGRLGLSASRAAAVELALLEQPVGARDELGRLAQLWARAEQGGPSANVPSRLVLSGHGTSGRLFGEDNGSLNPQALAKLAQALPRAAAQVRHLVLAGCETGGEAQLEPYREAFPNLEDAVAFEGTSPLSGEGAEPLLLRWAHVTAAPQRALALNDFAGVPHASHLALWTREGGYARSLGERGATPEGLRAQLRHTEARFLQYLERGEHPPASGTQGPLVERYRALSALNRLEPSPAVEAEVAQLLRLRYYPEVAAHFHEAYGDRLERGFAAVGLAAPGRDLLQNRREALAARDRLQSALEQLPNAPAEALSALALLDRGLVRLESAFIPDGWIAPPGGLGEDQA